MLFEIFNTSGYRRTEYFLACITASKKKNFESEYSKLVREHKDRRVSEKQLMEEMKKAKEEKEKRRK